MLVCIDSELVRRGLSAMLSALDFVGEVRSCIVSTLDSSSSVFPFDVLIVSCEDLVDSRAYLVAEDAVRRGAKILVLLGRQVEENLDAVTQLPGHGFLTQEDLTEEALGRALGRILIGEIPMPAGLAHRLLARARDTRATARPEGVRLTPREREALELLVEGLSNKQMARRMLISQHGVKRLVANVLAKLNCSNRTIAAAVAVKQGLLEETDGAARGCAVVSRL
ncbi:MAG: response regulator transcription factor [Micromonosporaceae bacterium]|nr:response regulator transcription factor [Micromonosporaceae bacterium]